MSDQAPTALLGYRIDKNGHDVIEARVRDGQHEQVLHGEGEGAISAFVSAWMKHSGQKIHVVDYSEHAIGEGTNAEAVAYVQLNVDGRRIAGAAFDHDTISASLKAVLSALNRVQIKREQVA